MISLDGCRTEPLGSYLQGLGAWRAVVRLVDSQARARWSGGRLELQTDLDGDQLLAQLAERFEPLSIVSPWNAGSGFAGNGKSKEAERALELVRTSDDPRLASLARAVLAADAVVTRGRTEGWGGRGDELWDKNRKPDVVRLCRNVLPDDALRWLDATVVLGQDETGEDALTYSRLLGTGGNFGRQDLQSTYLQRATAVLIDARLRRQSAGWLRAALYDDESTPYLRESVGQFDPGRAGGIQSSPAEKSDDTGFANPWSFLLTIEGALLFASAVTRRQGAQNARASVPFLVRASSVGFGSAALNENALGEIWTPEWDRFATLPEIEHLLGEGRADWNGKPARSGLDFVRAVATLGVDRGIRRFTRSVFVERHGQSPLAVPVGVVDVRERTSARLLVAVDNWVEHLRRAPLTAGVETQLRQLDQAMYDVGRDGGPGSLRRLLVALGRLHESVGRSGAVRARVRPLMLTDATSWCLALGADLSELRVARALTSGLDRPGQALSVLLRGLLTPVTTHPPGRLVDWSTDAVTVPGGTGITAALAEAHRRRAMPGAVPDPLSGSYRPNRWPDPAVRGVFSAFRLGLTATLNDVSALVTGGLDEELLGDLVRGLLLFDWSNVDRRAFPLSEVESPHLLPPALSLLLPFFDSRPMTVRLQDDDPAATTLTLRPGSSWLSLIRAGAIDRVAEDAVLRLNAAGVHEVISPRGMADAVDGDRLAAALLVRVRQTDRIAALTRVAALPPQFRPTQDLEGASA